MEYRIKSDRLRELVEKYDMDLEEVVNWIKRKNFNKIAIQIPDGFKLHSMEISDFISENSGAEVYIWGGSTYGACDIPVGLEKLGIKAIIQFGHARFRADELKKPSGIKND